MCGRLNVHDNEGVRILLAMLGMKTWPSRDPRYNIAPTQALDVVQQVDGDLLLTPMSWGVSMTLPGKSGKMITRRIPNSRDDKVWTSRLWKKLVAEQRVLIPVNGFYEWKRKNKKIEAAYSITPSKGKAMFFAGIYRAPKGEEKPEVSIITTHANKAMSAVHDRMPVILGSQNEAMAWVQDADRDTLDALMVPARNDALAFTQVSAYVNKSTNEGPECLAPISA